MCAVLCAARSLSVLRLILGFARFTLGIILGFALRLALCRILCIIIIGLAISSRILSSILCFSKILSKILSCSFSARCKSSCYAVSAACAKSVSVCCACNIIRCNAISILSVLSVLSVCTVCIVSALRLCSWNSSVESELLISEQVVCVSCKIMVVVVFQGFARTRVVARTAASVILRCTS